MKRRTELIKEEGIICQKFKQKMAINMNIGRKLEVSATTASNVYCVTESANKLSSRVVDVKKKTCSCGAIQEYGYPCSHFCAVIFKFCLNDLNFIDQRYMLENIREIYSGTIKMVDITTLEKNDDVTGVVESKRKGRPKKKRIPSRGENVVNAPSIQNLNNTQKLRYKCSICKRAGHTKPKCPSKK